MKTKKTDAKPTHTPGPWEYEDGDDGVYGDGGECVAEVPADRTYDSWTHDARLIAAAPDLLAALLETKAIEDAERNGIPMTQSVNHMKRRQKAMDMRLAAIAKAEGR